MVAETANLDGWVVYVGPTGAATYTDAQWDVAFGGIAGLVRIREGAPLTALGVSGGGLWFSRLAGGRAYGQIDAATTAGIPIGLSLGATAEIHRIDGARPGVYGSVWAFVGVVPYLRLGTIEETGIFIDLGIRIALPAARFGQ